MNFWDYFTHYGDLPREARRDVISIPVDSVDNPAPVPLTSAQLIRELKEALRTVADGADLTAWYRRRVNTLLATAPNDSFAPRAGPKL